MTRLAIIVLCLAAVSCTRTKPPTAESSPPEETVQTYGEFVVSPSDPGAKPPTDAEVHKLSVAEFLEACKDANAAIAKYSGSWLEITGKVGEIGVQHDLPIQSGSHRMRLLVWLDSPDQYHLDSVACEFPLGEQPWNMTAVGEVVTLRGYLANRPDSSQPHLAGSKFVSKSTRSTPVLSVEELYSKLEKDYEAFIRDYVGGNKRLIVYGKFSRQERPTWTEERSSANKWCVLKSDYDEEFYAYGVMPFPSDVEEGDPVAVIGTFPGFQKQDIPKIHLWRADDITPFFDFENAEK